ncbi:MAG: carboxypeptidase regulatory-like domain-containing protein [Deltaproteobacteria bacterium]|nr:carboxypeptidase regulatory-like domain-containing protein [Deltaproteobacteria bacterium]
MIRKIMFFTLISAALVLLASQQACLRTQRITIAGTVYLTPQLGGSTAPAVGAAVTVTTDVNGNGRIEWNERATAITGLDGRYSVTARVTAGLQSVVRFAHDGYAPLVKTLQINTARNISGFDGSLAPMDSLTDAQNGKWRNQSGSVEVTCAKVGGGSVRNFNPVTEADKFPGSFSDSSGNMLVSGVFTAFELEDAAGEKLATTDPGSPARIRMRMPRDTWASVVDTAPGTDRIDVPMYYFDEATGQWKRGTTEAGQDLSGWLEQENGDLIAESQLAAVRNGTFSGQIFAASDVTHFSYWNVDWPIESHGCISGTLRDADGNPVAGATVNVQGLTYAGASSPQTTDENGAFCVDVMRSEAAGEDVNQNGVTGETQRVLISGSSGGTLYNFGEFDIPAQAGSCPDNCLAVELTASAATQVEPAVCALAGTAYLEGTPTAGISVYAFDDMLDPQAAIEVCGTACTYFDVTDPSGAFSLTAPFALKIGLTGYYAQQIPDPAGQFIYMATSTLTGCPAGQVDLDLELLYCFVSLPAITYAAGVISLDPGDFPLTALMVVGGLTGVKWTVMASDADAGFAAASITYGTVPAGAEQTWPLAGAAPAAISAGDMIMVVPLGGYVPYAGRQCYSNSQYMVQ